MTERNTTAQNARAQSVRVQEALVPEAPPLGAAEQAQLQGWLRWISQALSLPGDWVSFAMFTMVLAVLSGGLVLHIHLSSQIYRTQLKIGQQEIAYDEIAHQNTELIWQISQFTSLNSIHRRAEAMGYVPATQQFYVAETSVRTASVSTTNAAAPTAPETVDAGTGSSEQIAFDRANEAWAPAAVTGSPNSLTNTPHPPTFAVRMQQRMANVGQWMQNWWQ